MQTHHRKRSRVVPPGFGPRASDITVTPRAGEPGSDIKVRKPYTAMTIRVTPELLARLQRPGPKPSIKVDLKSVAEGGPVLIVDGIQYNTNAHHMAVGSEVHMLARTDLQPRPLPDEREGSRAAASMGNPSWNMSMLASLHRKIIVQQVLTAAKRAEIRARTEDSARQIQEAKKTNMVVIDDQEEMLLAAEAIPVPARQAIVGAGATGYGNTRKAAQDDKSNGDHRTDRKRARLQQGGGEAGEHGEADGEAGSATRGDGGDRFTAWFYDCYNHDDYTGHVSDLQKFLSGIEMGQVMFRYHVKPNGKIDPDRRRFCIRFKTEAGCDLAIARSGEALGASGSWSPDSVSVVRGRADTADDVPGAFLLVLPAGSSVAEVLKKVEARLPRDLKPAVMAPSHLARSEAEGHEFSDYRYEKPDGRAKSDQSKEVRRRARKIRMEGYRRDMRRAALGAKIASAIVQGPEWESPDGRLLGTEEDNTRRVATLAASEAIRVLGGGAGKEEATTGAWEPDASGVASSGRRRKPVDLPSGPAGGAREHRRFVRELAARGERQVVDPQE